MNGATTAPDVIAGEASSSVEHKLKRVPLEERDAMKKLADPVMATYAKEIGAEGIFEKINVA